VRRERLRHLLRASKYPFENAIQDKTRKLEVREREFAVLDVKSDPARRPAIDGKARKLETGFWSISGATVGADGALYFVEKRFQRIYRWTEAKGLEVVRDHALDPVNLAIDRSGKLLVLSSYGPEGQRLLDRPERSQGPDDDDRGDPSAARADAKTLLPVNWWNNGEFRISTIRRRTTSPPWPRCSPATSGAQGQGICLARRQRGPAGLPRLGAGAARPCRLALVRQPADPRPDRRLGRRAVFVTNGSENKTYSGKVGPGGVLTDLKVFANRGGESVAVDGQGQVFVANGQIFKYAADGQPLAASTCPSGRCN
jgi:hypothetical protein